MDFWVPGCCSRQENERFRGKKLFAEILTTSNETAMAYVCRATQDIDWKAINSFFDFFFPFWLILIHLEDFARKVPKDAAVKLKESRYLFFFF